MNLFGSDMSVCVCVCVGGGYRVTLSLESQVTYQWDIASGSDITKCVNEHRSSGSSTLTGHDSMYAIVCYILCTESRA